MQYPQPWIHSRYGLTENALRYPGNGIKHEGKLTVWVGNATRLRRVIGGIMSPISPLAQNCLVAIKRSKATIFCKLHGKCLASRARKLRHNQQRKEKRYKVN